MTHPNTTAIGWALLQAGRARPMRWTTVLLGVASLLVGLPLICMSAPNSTPAMVTTGLLLWSVFGAALVLVCMPGWMARIACRGMGHNTALRRLLLPVDDTHRPRQHQADLSAVLGPDHPVLNAALFVILQQHGHTPTTARTVLRDTFYQTVQKT